MNGDIIPYVVRQGDYLKRIADALSFDAAAVWNHPKNAELKSRRDPNLLHPGDLLWVPKQASNWRPISGGMMNKYVAKIPKTTISLGFKNENGPLTNEPYVVEGLGAQREGTTDEQGTLVVEVPVHLREFRVSFPRQNAIHPVRVGDMDPIDELSGLRKRLQHLGYYKRSPGESTSLMMSEGDIEACDQQAIVKFQRAHGLEATGLSDDAVKATLVKEHGS
jgi:Putative peptidoglycan binding domain